MVVKDMHFYDAVEGHGLPHDPLNGIIGPLPIGWISSRDQDGTLNLAPYSFFNGLNYNPHILGFSSTSWKDTVAVIERTGEFVWNLATMDLAEAMNATAAGVPRDVDEFQLAGLTPVPSRFCAPGAHRTMPCLLPIRRSRCIARPTTATGRSTVRCTNRCWSRERQ